MSVSDEPSSTDGQRGLTSVKEWTSFVRWEDLFQIDSLQDVRLNRFIGLPVALLLVVSLQMVLCAGPESIHVLMIGQVFPYETPVAGWLESDPAFDYVVVPVRKDTGGWQQYPEKEAQRYVRMYFPRSFDLLTGYDFLCYVDTYFGHLSGRQIDWMFRAIRDFGLGGLTTLGGGISWVPEFRESWESSSVASAFPTDYLQPTTGIRYVENFRLSVSRRAGTLPVFLPFLPLGIEDQLGRQAAQLSARDGSITFATMRATGSEDLPFAVAWRYGKGRTWSVATDIQTSYNLWWTRWQAGEGFLYAMDLFLNMVLYSTGRPIPQDVLQFHRLREFFHTYHERKSMLFALMDFVERFGANRRAIDREVEAVDAIESKARDLYLEQDLDGAEELAEQAKAKLHEAEDHSIRLKNRALLWVYLVEWTAVLATLMISASALWTIMVRRRIYRAATTTHLRQER